MPATVTQFSTSFQSTMTRALNVFGSQSSPASSLTFNLVGLNLATWNQTFENVYTLFAVAPAGLAASVVAGGSLAVGSFFYKVTAVGYGSYSTTNETSGSNEATGTTTTGNQTINLTWTALSGAVSYNIYRGTATGAENTLIGNVTTTSFSDNGTATGTSQSPPASMPPNFVEFDLSSFTTLANETATPGHLLGLIFLPTGTIGSSQCTLAPGTTNGLTGLFTGTTPALTLRINGVSVPVCGPATGDAGIAITSTSKTLRVTNGGTQATTVTVGAIVGP